MLNKINRKYYIRKLKIANKMRMVEHFLKKSFFINMKIKITTFVRG